MRPIRTGAFVAMMAIVAALPLSANASGDRPDPIVRPSGPIAGQYIVSLRNGATDVPGAASAIARMYGGRVGFVYRSAVKGFSVRMSEDRARRMAADSRVALVEQDGRVGLVATQSNPPWGLDRIDQRDLPLNALYTYNATGANVRAYILDTGIRLTHADFGGRASSGYDAIDGGAATDCHGHGTHVAGTVGGTTYGVAKSVALVAVRVLDCLGSGSYSQVIAGVDWVTRNRVLPAVANMSLGGGASSTLDTAVKNSINSGVTYAIAAGNGDLLGNAVDACGTSPARVAAAITVSATDSSDRKASWANYGTCLDIFAPGVSVKSAWSSSDTATSTISGTSMAAPHVAGVAAQYLEGNRSATPSTVASALTTNATTGKVQSPGSGSPNRLLYSAFIGGGAPPPNAAPTASFTHSCSGLSCSFTDTSTDSDGTVASRNWDFGDGTGSTATNPSHSYAAAGTYTVTLTVTDDDGATASTSKAITVSAPTDPDPSTPTLSDGVALSDTNGARGTWKYYKIQVPAGKTQLKVDLAGTASCGSFGCNPDLDLYVRRGAKPTTSTFSCRSAGYTANESCSVSSPAADWWYVGVYVYNGTSSITYSIKATVS